MTRTGMPDVAYSMGRFSGPCQWAESMNQPHFVRDSYGIDEQE